MTSAIIDIQTCSHATGRQTTEDRARRRLEEHARIWDDRPLVRAIYRGYHEAIDSARSAAPGADVEIGAGHGSFAEFRPGTISCDIVPCPWLDCAADATSLPFADAALSNIIMVDVLHHIADPARFFTESTRVLAPGGRIIMIEPYVSPISYLAWRFFHDEDVDLEADPLDGQQTRSTNTDATRHEDSLRSHADIHARQSDETALGRTSSDDPWDANTAIPTLLFWRNISRFRNQFPQLSVITRRRFDYFLYPLSGGFERRPLIPRPLIPVARLLERALTPLQALLAFRCMITIEKK